MPLTDHDEYMMHRELDALEYWYDDEPGYDIGVCMAGHYGRLGKPCIRYNPETGRNEECGEFV